MAARLHYRAADGGDSHIIYAKGTEDAKDAAYPGHGSERSYYRTATTASRYYSTASSTASTESSTESTESTASTESDPLAFLRRRHVSAPPDLPAQPGPRRDRRIPWRRDYLVEPKAGALDLHLPDLPDPPGPAFWPLLRLLVAVAVATVKGGVSSTTAVAVAAVKGGVASTMASTVAAAAALGRKARASPFWLRAALVALPPVACGVYVVIGVVAGSRIAAGIEHYAHQPAPLTPAFSPKCAPLAEALLHYPDYARALGFPPPLLPALYFLSAPPQRAHYRLRRFILCFDESKCRHQPGVSAATCRDMLALAHHAANKLMHYRSTIRSWPPRFSPAKDDRGTLEHRFGREVLLQQSATWNASMTVAQARLPRYDACLPCDVWTALDKAAAQIWNDALPTPPQTLDEAARAGCRCDLKTALSPYLLLVSLELPAYLRPPTADGYLPTLSWPGWSALLRGRWLPAIAWNQMNLPPRRIHWAWFDDDAWRIPKQESDTIHAWLSNLFFRAFMFCLRTWGRGGQSVPDYEARAGFSIEDRRHLVEQGWLAEREAKLNPMEDLWGLGGNWTDRILGRSGAYGDP